MFSHNLCWKDVQQRNDGQGESDPVKTDVQGNTQNGAQERQYDTQERFVKDVGKEQNDEQTQNQAEEKHFAKNGDTAISTESADQPARFDGVKEDISAFGPTHFV